MEENKILEDYGWCKIFQKGEDYFISYDAGGVAVQMKTINVTKSQTEIALKSEIDAEKVIRKIIVESQK